MRTLVLALLAATASAAVPDAAGGGSAVYLDLRARLGGGAPVEETESGGSTATWEFVGAAEGNIGAVLRHRVGSVLGYGVGLGIFWNVHAGDDDSIDTTVRYGAAGLEADGLVFWELTPRLHIELMGQYQVGRGFLVVDDEVDEIDGETGDYQAWGAVAGCYYTFRFGLLVGGQFGWQAFVGESEFQGADTTTSGDGVQGALVLGYSFF